VTKLSSISNYDQFAPVLPILSQFGKVRQNVLIYYAKYGQTWTNMTCNGPVWPVITKCVQLWPIVNKYISNRQVW
jgi:hypothetical protein